MVSLAKRPEQHPLSNVVPLRRVFVSGTLTTNQMRFIPGTPCDRHPKTPASVKYLFPPQMELRILNNRMFKANRYSELYLCTLCEVLNDKEAKAQSLMTIHSTRG